MIWPTKLEGNWPEQKADYVAASEDIEVREGVRSILRILFERYKNVTGVQTDDPGRNVYWIKQKLQEDLVLGSQLHDELCQIWCQIGGGNIRSGMTNLNMIIEQLRKDRQHDTRASVDGLKELLDCIHNLMGIFDTPIARRAISSDMAEEVRSIGRKILEDHGRTTWIKV